CQIDNWRWSGVPFYLRTGKRMAEGARIISIAFHEPPQSMFPAGSGVGDYGPDHLTFDLDESSRLSLSFYGKRPGPGMTLEKLSMQFSLVEIHSEADTLEAYERLIRDAMYGDHTLFTTAEGIELDPKRRQEGRPRPARFDQLDRIAVVAGHAADAGPHSLFDGAPEGLDSPAQSEDVGELVGGEHGHGPSSGASHLLAQRRLA